MTVDLNEVVAEQLAPKIEMSKEDWEKYLSMPYPHDSSESSIIYDPEKK